MDDRDYKRVAQAALDNPSAWLPELMGGRQQGREWVGERTRNGGIGDSWSFELKSGLWGHFGGDERGNDAISLVAAVHRTNQSAAYDWLARQLGAERAPNPHVRVLPRHAAPEPPEEPCEPIPELVPDPDWGRLPMPAIYRYGREFWITRHDLEDGAKTFRWWTWRQGNWQPKAPPSPRRLFHVELLDRDKSVPVLLVEGEKCVLAAKPMLTAFNLITWAGGVGSWRHAHWEALEGRPVVIWPDHDEPGTTAAAQIGQHLARIAASVKIIHPPADAPKGWDLADAIAEGWDVNRLIAHIRENAVESIPETITKEKPFKAKDAGESAPKLNGHHTENAPPSEIVTRSAIVDWHSLGIACDSKGIPHVSLANISRILKLYDNFKGRIWLDDFRGIIYHTLRGSTPQRWTDADTRALTVRVQEDLQLQKFNSRLVEEGLRQAAESYRRNSLTEWLNGLQWDGNERLNTWLSDCLGLELTDYTMAVSRNWPIAMVARAFQPGCKMDNMPVLEGISGLRKTQFLNVLGGEWYKSLSMQFGEKDFLQSLRGAWLVEIPDMAGFKRADHTKVLAIITTATDTYRVPYGREPEDIPRTCVFSATSETSDYLEDSRGKRRYWPLRCTEINLETLRQQRDWIFAEALLQYRAGATWYEMPASAAIEQSDRVEPDEWIEPVLSRAEAMWEMRNQSPAARTVTAKRILTEVLDVPLGQITTGQCRRVKTILSSNGWHRYKDQYGWAWKPDR